MYIDCHTHILPGIDDGSKDEKESSQMLDMLRSQGIGSVFATPHFYSTEQDIDSFLQQREKAYKRVSACSAMDIRLGAEVYFTRGINTAEDMKKLTLGSSNYLLIEMPYARFGSKEIEQVEDVYYRLGLVPVIAHIERCLAFVGMETVEELMALPEVVCQFNAQSIVERRTRKKTLRLMGEAQRMVLGSDTHNMTSRPSYYDKAMEILKEKLPAERVDLLLDTAKKLLI